MREIGSSFWEAGARRDGRRHRFLLSGRTALEYIIRDMLLRHPVKSVFMPSYCCGSMLEPFTRHGIEIRFYDVLPAGAGLAACVPEPEAGAVFFYMRYFGFGKLEGLREDALDGWDAVVEDCTHSWMRSREPVPYGYKFASYRKWTGITAASAARYGQGFLLGQENRTYDAYERTWAKAAGMKRRFIEEGAGDRQAYLALYGRAEELLEKEYAGYAPALDSVSGLYNFDRRQAGRIRRRNAGLLMEALANISGLKLLFTSMEPEDVPLCVPILLCPEKRDGLRRHLAGRGIYCPVHWPLSAWHTGLGMRAKEIYSSVLSLICDQRYGEADMQREADAVKGFF